MEDVLTSVALRITLCCKTVTEYSLEESFLFGSFSSEFSIERERLVGFGSSNREYNLPVIDFYPWKYIFI